MGDPAVPTRVMLESHWRSTPVFSYGITADGLPALNTECEGSETQRVRLFQ